MLLSHLSDRHLCFTLDDTVWYPGGDPRGSIHFVKQCPLLQAEKTEFVIGPTQRTLPTHKFDHTIDLALIDGAHGYPFPELDYYFLYPHLAPGSMLIVDDIHIPTIRHLAEFLSEDEMFEQIDVEGTTAFFQRTAVKTFDPEGDGWTKQRFNINRFKPYDRRSVIRRGLRTVVQKFAPSLMDRYSRSRLAGRW